MTKSFLPGSSHASAADRQIETAARNCERTDNCLAGAIERRFGDIAPFEFILSGKPELLHIFCRMNDALRVDYILKMAITVRELIITDSEAWLPLWHGYLKFYNTDLSEETTRTTWRRLTDPNEPMFALGAFADDRLLGIVHIIYHRSCWTEGNYCYLQDLFTAEDARGHGVGTALIEAVYARAKTDGASRVHWLTHETNTTAQKLYEKVAARSGFIQYRKILSL